MKKALLAVITTLSLTSFCAAADVIGAIARTETSPAGPRSYKTTEKVTFRFPVPVDGRFWWDYETNTKDQRSDARVEVPYEHVPANTEFTLAFVRNDKELRLTATTTHDGSADPRSRVGVFPPLVGTRTVTYWPTSERVPIDKDFAVYTIEYKSTRAPFDTRQFRVFARFTIPK